MVSFPICCSCSKAMVLELVVVRSGCAVDHFIRWLYDRISDQRNVEGLTDHYVSYVYIMALNVRFYTDFMWFHRWSSIRASQAGPAYVSMVFMYVLRIEILYPMGIGLLGLKIGYTVQGGSNLLFPDADFSNMLGKQEFVVKFNAEVF